MEGIEQQPLGDQQNLPGGAQGAAHQEGEQENLQQRARNLEEILAAAQHAANQQPPPAQPLRGSNKPPKPQTFHANKDANLVRSWVLQVDLYFAAVSEPDSTKLNYAVALLRENALIWWQSLKPEERPRDWPSLGQLMINYFAPLSATINARDRLAKLQQKSSVRIYTDEFKRLVLNIPDISEPEKMDRYRRGLKTQVKLLTTFANPGNFDAMCLTAEQIDCILFRERSERSYSYSSTRDGAGPSNSQPTPMEIGAISERRNSYADAVKKGPQHPKLTAAEKSKLMQSGGCFYCRENGHRVSDCPKKKGKQFRRQ